MSMSEFINLPKIGKIGKVLKKIIPIGKMIADILQNISKTGGNTKSTAEDSSPETIEQIADIFWEFKKQVRIKTEEIENIFKQEVESYLEEVKDILIDNQDVTDKYEIRMNRIERQINQIIPKMIGVIDLELNKKVSLDNSECRNIMKMLPGRKKEEALDTFLSKSLEETLENCCTNLRKNLKEIDEEVNENIVGTIESIKNTIENQKQQLQNINSENYVEKSKEIMSNAGYIFNTCELIEKIMEE